MRILAISGSLREDSHNTALLRAAATLLPPAARLELFAGLEHIPPLNEDRLSPRPAAVQRLWDAVSEADAVLISTPEYNHSIPGQLKNALDWLSRPLARSPLKGKPVAVIGASTGMFGAVWAQAETRKVLGAIGARVLDAELPLPNADEQFVVDGALRDEAIAAELEALTSELVGLASERTLSPAA